MEWKLVIASGSGDPRTRGRTTSLVFRGQRKKKPRDVALELTVPKKLFRSDNRYPAVIQGNLMVTSSAFFAKKTTLPVSGTVRFEAASTDAGRAVRDTLKMKIYKFSRAE